MPEVFLTAVVVFVVVNVDFPLFVAVLCASDDVEDATALAVGPSRDLDSPSSSSSSSPERVKSITLFESAFRLSPRLRASDNNFRLLSADGGVGGMTQADDEDPVRAALDDEAAVVSVIVVVVVAVIAVVITVVAVFPIEA